MTKNKYTVTFDIVNGELPDDYWDTLDDRDDLETDSFEVDEDEVYSLDLPLNEAWDELFVRNIRQRYDVPETSSIVIAHWE